MPDDLGLGCIEFQVVRAAPLFDIKHAVNQNLFGCVNVLYTCQLAELGVVGKAMERNTMSFCDLL